MAEGMNKENEEDGPQPKKMRVSLSLQKKADRFNFDVEDSEILEAMKGNTVKNTVTNNKWAPNNFTHWCTARQEKAPLFEQDKRKPLEVLLTEHHEELCKILSSFVMETRKEDGTEYTPKSIYLMVAGLQRGIRTHKGRSSAINIFSDTRLEAFHNVCDHKFRTLHQHGIGTKSKHAEALTDEDERKLWETNVLNLSTPQGLLNCVFFYNGKYLCLRGGNEHRLLRFSQFNRETAVLERKEVACYVYTEQG